MPGSERRRSAAVVRRRLARELERCRKEAGLTQSTAAKALGWSPRKQQLLEAGDQAVSARDLEVILSKLAIPSDFWPEWHDLAAAAQTKSWWDGYSDADLAQSSKRYIGYEQGATRIRSFDPLVINGLLQTPGYREAIIRGAAVTPRPGEQVASLIEVTWLRQQVLFGSDPLVLWTILDEAALRREVGSSEVMAAQLNHLAGLAEQHDTVTVQVIPFAAGPHAGLGGSFSILEFGWPNDAGFVYLESGPDHTSYLEERTDIYFYSQVFDRLDDSALPPDRSIELLRDLAKQSRP